MEEKRNKSHFDDNISSTYFQKCVFSDYCDSLKITYKWSHTPEWYYHYNQCRRVHSAENNCVRGKVPTNGGTPGLTGGVGGVGGVALTGEELRLVRAVRAQYARRGGFVRIFPSQNSWQKYAQYLGEWIVLSLIAFLVKTTKNLPSHYYYILFIIYCTK